jgi:hypothetical protein
VVRCIPKRNTSLNPPEGTCQGQPWLRSRSPGAGRSKTRIRDDDLADYIERQTRGGAATA